jgi:hypothetical protein
MMKKIMFISIAILLFSSCAIKKPLYSWDKYGVKSYNYLKNSTDKSIQELIETYQKIIENQTGTRGIVPPGVFADYGFILLQENKTEEGKALLLKEIALYPESKIFIDRILKIIEK